MSYKSIITGFLMMMATGTGYSQFVDIRIELQTYNELKIIGDTISGVKNRVPLQWLRISTQENIELYVEVKYHLLPDNEKRLEMKTLNNNSSDLSAALPVEGNFVTMPVCANSGPAEGKKVPDLRFTAWIGFPARQISELIVQYN